MFEPGVKFRFGWRVEGPVGFAKLEDPTRTGGDKPSVFMNKPVVKPAEEDQIVQIGGSAFRPVDNMMNLKPVVVVTSVKHTGSPVTMMNQPS
jgi:hypothetical protein